MNDVGPIYGVLLIDTLPLDGGIKQSMPSRRDLDDLRDTHINGRDRIVAGYEVLLEHYLRLCKAVNNLRPVLNDCTNGELFCHDIEGTSPVRKQFLRIKNQISIVLDALDAGRPE